MVVGKLEKSRLLTERGNVKRGSFDPSLCDS